MTAPIGISWSSPPDADPTDADIHPGDVIAVNLASAAAESDLPSPAETDALAARIHAARGGEDFLVPVHAKLRPSGFRYRVWTGGIFAQSGDGDPYAPTYPSLWTRFIAWARKFLSIDADSAAAKKVWRGSYQVPWWR